ncbi:MAG TPA: hypothetical protein VGO50_19455 [Pyrinomonadaceae bacterium]|nr:hypothetical protein [Pyrinomonadaceae bacterium]
MILIIAWLVNCFRPEFPFPILLLSGEQGTAKSTTSRLLRELIDPSITPFRSSPKNEQDLVIAATNSWVIGLDNLSFIPDWLSDALCRLSTGGGFGARKLYSDDEEAIFTAKRPIVINGIGELASRSDLLDRALIVKLNPIPQNKRKTESAFWKEFEYDKASIFSGILSAVSYGLKNFERVKLEHFPRMADFAQWVSACEGALEWDKGAFLSAYSANRQDAHSLVLEDSLLAEVLQEFCERNVINDEYDVSDVLLKDFLAQLKDIAGEKRSSDKRFPKTSKGLRSAIERVNPNLREIGIFITFYGRKGSNASKGASLALRYSSSQTSQASQTSLEESTDLYKERNLPIVPASPTNNLFQDQTDVSIGHAAETPFVTTQI